MDSPDERQLAALFDRLLVAGASPRGDWPLTDGELMALGLKLFAGQVGLPDGLEILEHDAIVDALDGTGRDWLTALRLHRVIGSTNTELRELARTAPVHGLASLAELQVAGRGRHGRQWFSPFGANLALSLGFHTDRPAPRLAGLSLAVGLAVADALGSFGAAPLALKWPNDLLLDGAKLGGILVELVPAQRGSRVIVGVGLNLGLTSAQTRHIDQPAANLIVDGSPPVGFRNRLAGRIISSVAYFVQKFDEYGFAPMRGAFDELHFYHGRRCQLVHGADSHRGVVRGVTDQGELLLDTGGETVVFGAGEVSLRQA